jgi:hypothetical protein
VEEHAAESLRRVLQQAGVRPTASLDTDKTLR